MAVWKTAVAAGNVQYQSGAAELENGLYFSPIYCALAPVVSNVERLILGFAVATLLMST